MSRPPTPSPTTTLADVRAAHGGRSVDPISIRIDADDERRAVAQVEIVIPVYNEERGLEASIRRLDGYLEHRFPLGWLVTIADNASTDRTWAIACRLATELEGVQAVHLDQKGRGRALRATWLSSQAPVVAYMDVDLSTDLDALLPLVAPLVSGHSEVAIGTRLAPGARVVRGPKREAISRCYNLLLKTGLRSGFSDAQCGCKAVRSDVARTLVPMIEDESWFFDTELLVLAEHNGMRIHEVPVDWVDDPDSRVDVVRTATDDVRCMWRMMRSAASGKGEAKGLIPREDPSTAADLGSQLVRFAPIGVVSASIYALLLVLLMGSVGIFAANVIALAVCAVATAPAHRRLTFSLHGRASRGRHPRSALALSALPFAATSAVAAMATVGGGGTAVTLVAAMAVTNLAAHAIRYAALRTMAGPRARTPAGSGHQKRAEPERCGDQNQRAVASAVR